MATEAAAGAPSASKEQTAPALADWGIEATPALQQPCDAAHQSSTEEPRKKAVPPRKVSKKGRKRARSSAAQQENSAAELAQQPVAPLEGRQPLAAMRAQALNLDDSIKRDGKPRKKDRQTGSAAAHGTQRLSDVLTEGNADSSASRHRQPGGPAACPMATARAGVSIDASGHTRPRKAGPAKPVSGILCLSSGGGIHLSCNSHSITHTHTLCGIRDP